ncbi:uncharacterized protein LOC108092408 [Drosophila ficusphila]|uniref:uncharacterized protein LOC108092408 n=1 Tax=Drosophila ficusphila TaxID=30025 RepID=UPI0007E7FE76|nr:uncharacterized protein LOC108092408 [Drosophila ficusphila]
MPARQVLNKERPIMKRRMTISGPRPLPSPLPVRAKENLRQPNFLESLNNNSDIIIRRSMDQILRERIDSRLWNDNNSGNNLSRQLLMNSTPPPPQNLNWNDRGFQPNGSSNMMGFRNFDDQPQNRGCNEYIQNDVMIGGREPERFIPNDNFQQGYRPVMTSRNIQEPEFRNESLMDCQTSMVEDCSFDSGFSGPQSGFNNRDFREENMVRNGNQVNKRRSESLSGGREMFEKTFSIGGFKLPYVTNIVGQPPFAASRSHAVRFFKKQPDYIISVGKSKKVPTVQHIYIENKDAEELEEVFGGKDNPLSQFSGRSRESFAAEFTKIYRGRNYGKWEGWWKDFRNIDVDINEQLAKFDCFNVKYNFQAPGGACDPADLIQRANIALTKNRNSYLGNMRVVYGLMDHSLLANLNMDSVAQLQDIIRSVPNHLWIYKLRCMVFIWYKFSQVMKSEDTGDRKHQFILKEWRSPVVHWLAKQAFLELRTISRSEYPQYSEVYGRNSKGSKE